MSEDSALLRRYAETRAEDAFAELVRRHLTLVYSVALRQVGGDAHLAQDVAQTVFTALARKSCDLAGREVITGWLYRSTHYAASDAVRAERRRRAREQEAHVMQELTAPAGPAPDLETLRPVLDAAIGELSETDRDAVCLRFFENRSYGEIGSRLHLSENSALMRMERALDKLHGLLARRGITSTTAALALALPGQAATCAPAGLATTIASSALIAGSSVAAGWTLLALMNTPKVAFTTAALISAISLGTALHLRNDAMADLAAAREARATADARVTELESKLASYAKAAAAAEEDNARLLATVDSAAAQLKRFPKPADESITHDSVEARYKRAQALNKAGNLEEALAEYLWCYDIGMPQIVSFTGVRVSAVLSEIAKLGDRLPRARDALRQRQAAALSRFMASEKDSSAAQDLAALNRVLNREAETLDLLDRLPPTDPRRSLLLPLVYDQLTQAQRYKEAAEARPYNQASSVFEMFATRRLVGADPTLAAVAQQRQRSFTIRQAATSIEVFAGAGDIEHAADLAIRLLEFDSSPETIALLEKHAARAGHPDLISTLRAK